MKKTLYKNSNKIIGLIYIIIGLFLIVTNGVNVYAEYSNEKKLLTSFYNNDKDIQEIEEMTVTDSNNVVKTTTVTDKKDYSVVKTTDYIKDSVLDEYIAVVKIPKINLEKGLFSKTSKYNDVEHNIMIHEKSDNPTVDKGNVILVAHSGTAEISFFKRLNELVIGDNTEIYYHGKKYTYVVTNIYEVDKTGTVEIKRDNDKKTLTMITCKHGTNKQIVVISELQKTSEY